METISMSSLHQPELLVPCIVHDLILFVVLHTDALLSLVVPQAVFLWCNPERFLPHIVWNLREKVRIGSLFFL